MPFLFHRGPAIDLAPREPVLAEVPVLHRAELAASHFGERHGGDLYDFIRVSPNRVLFGLLDVAGKPDQNRTIVSAAQQTFRKLPVELFAAEDVNEAEAMTGLCLNLNHSIMTAEGGVRSCPAFAGCYNEELGTVCYFNAGHTPGLVRDSTGITELPATGLPLGLFSHATCEAPLVALEPGATLLLVSRGMLEARCKGEEFGFERVKQTLEQTEVASAQEVCQTLLQASCTSPVYNDVTALALVRLVLTKAPTQSV